MSRENEAKALEMLRKRCEEALNAYPSSAEDDVALLKKGKLSYNQRNCIVLRLGEKTIYQFYISLAQFVIELLQNKLIAVQNKFELDQKNAKAYIRAVSCLLTQ